MNTERITPLTWYYAGLVCFFIPGGLQMIMLPWLAAVQLGTTPEQLGVLQMSSALPSLVLILFGGMLADRIDTRTILVSGHLLAALPASLLALAIILLPLNFSMLVVYAVAMGVLTAFIQPARDGMLGHVAGGRLQQVVTVTMGLTFGCQLFGYIAAAFADQVGGPPILFLHSSIMLIGMLALLKLPRFPPNPAPGEGQLQGMKTAIELVVRSRRMAPAVILITFMSLFYGGTFAVLNPIVIRDVFDGSSAELSISYSGFMLGTVLMTVALVSAGGVHRQGRALLIASMAGAVCLVFAFLADSFLAYLVSIFFWGMCGAVAMSMSRTIVQEAAPISHRARVISIFSLGNLGGMPIGALLMGFVAGAIGPQPTLLVAAGGMALVTTALWLFSDVVSINRGEAPDELPVTD